MLSQKSFPIRAITLTGLEISRCMFTFNLLDPLHATPPTHTILGPLLDSGSQLSLMKVEIIHGADAQDAFARESATNTVHERAARRAEVVGHLVARRDSVRLAESLEVISATHVLQKLVVHCEVGGEHGCANLVAVRTIADEGVEQARGLCWLAIPRRY